MAKVATGLGCCPTFPVAAKPSVAIGKAIECAEFSRQECPMNTIDQPKLSPVSVVYFDGSCPLCAAEIAYYRTKGSAESINFVDVSQPSAEYGAGLDRRSAMARFHVRTANGSLVSGGAAFGALWGSVTGLAWVGRLASSSVGSKVLEAGYRASLIVRPWLASAYRHILRFAPNRQR